MQSEGSLQQPATCLYSKADQYRPCPTSDVLKIHFNIIFPSTPKSSSGLFLSGFPTKTAGIHNIVT
jgi:hypothetical protein